MWVADSLDSVPGLMREEGAMRAMKEAILNMWRLHEVEPPDSGNDLYPAWREHVLAWAVRKTLFLVDID